MTGHGAGRTASRMTRLAILASIACVGHLVLPADAMAETATVVIDQRDATPITLPPKPDSSDSLLGFFLTVIASPAPPIGRPVSLYGWDSFQPSEAPVAWPEPKAVTFPLENESVSAGYALFPAWWIDQRSDVRFDMAPQRDGRIVVYGTARPNARYSLSSGVIRVIVNGTRPGLAHCIMVSRERCLFGGIAIDRGSLDDLIRFLSFMMPGDKTEPARPDGYVARLGRAMIDEIADVR